MITQPEEKKCCEKCGKFVHMDELSDGLCHECQEESC
jgi:hypothetical protein